MNKLAYIENIVWAIVFLAILILLDGWAKAWAVVPMVMINGIPIIRPTNEAK